MAMMTTMTKIIFLLTADTAWPPGFEPYEALRNVTMPCNVYLMMDVRGRGLCTGLTAHVRVTRASLAIVTVGESVQNMWKNEGYPFSVVRYPLLLLAC